jgi:mannose-1-phosphate guanylyltransferase / phosphomannomutase
MFAGTRSKSAMKAVVMAGGEGSRLRPLTLGRPKPMVPIVNQPVIAHIIDLLKKHGITDIVVTLQYRAEDIQDAFGDGRQQGVNIRYSVEELPLGTAGSVKLAEDMLNEPFIVISGDALTDFDLTAIIKSHFERKAMATLTLTRVTNPLEYGVVITDGNGRVHQFQEKPSWGEIFSDTVNTGIYVLDPAIFKYMEKGVSYDWSQQIFPQMLEKGDPVYGYVADGYWSDVGNLQDYMRANADMLEGRVNVNMPGTHLGGNIWVEDDVKIDPDAQLYGPLYLGNGVRVKAGAIIRGPSVIRDFTIVDDRATIDRSIVWRNSYIGERAELRGAIVNRQCNIKSRAMLFEGVVLGDNTIVGESAVIAPNVKVWPGKEIERGATVNTSLIWGSQGRRVLFGRFGVTGLVNVDVTPEFAAKLGAAYGAILPKGSVVTVNREPHHTPRMIKRAILSGLPSAGVDVSDLGNLPVPVARYTTRNTENVQGGIHVRLSPFDNRTIDLKFFDKRGLDIDKNTERKIENVFFREDFRRVYLDEIGEIEYAPNPIERYSSDFLKRIDITGLESTAKMRRVVLDYSSANTSAILPSILDRMSCDVVALNAVLDETKLFRTTEQFAENMKRLGVITTTLDADVGFKLDTSGERLYATDNRGNQISPIHLSVAVAKLMFQTTGGGIIAVPVSAPNVLESLASKFGGEIIRTRNTPAALMQASLKSGVIMALDGDGGFIFPNFHPGMDAMFAAAKILELTMKRGERISEVVNSLPPFALMRTKVSCKWEDKGRVMRLLNEQYKNGERQIDGVRIPLGNEWVLVLPDPDRPLFHVIAESQSTEQAQILVDKYAGLVTSLQH